VVTLEIFDQEMMKSDAMGVVVIQLSDLAGGEVIDGFKTAAPGAGAEEADLGKLDILATFEPHVAVARHPEDITPLQRLQFTVGLGWDFEPTKDSAVKRHVDLDAAAVVFDKRGKMIEGAYFGNLHPALVLAPLCTWATPQLATEFWAGAMKRSTLT